MEQILPLGDNRPENGRFWYEEIAAVKPLFFQRNSVLLLIPISTFHNPVVRDFRVSES